MVKVKNISKRIKKWFGFPTVDQELIAFKRMLNEHLENAEAESKSTVKKKAPASKKPAAKKKAPVKKKPATKKKAAKKTVKKK